MICRNAGMRYFMKYFKLQVGVKKVSPDELLKIARFCRAVPKSYTLDQDLDFVKRNVELVEEYTFLFQKSSFNIGDIVYVSAHTNVSTYYSKRKKGQVVFIDNNYITVQFDKYKESILFITMKIGEYLVFKRRG